MALPPGAVLWSARVDDVAVRPLERGASIVVPLAFRAQDTAVVEVVAVEERTIERGRSELHLEAARVAEPVVRHECVKPLEVEIPETGKLLVMSGALPPPRVGVVLDVKAK